LFYNIIYNKDFIQHSKEGVRDKYTFLESIIPVEFETEFIPESIDYNQQLEPCQNYMNSIGMNVMLKVDEATKTVLQVGDSINYIKDYYKYNHFSSQFKQNAKSVWWQLGIIPMKISYQYTPRVINDKSIFSIDHSDIYLSFHVLNYYHYLSSYFSETRYFNNVLKIPTKYIKGNQVFSEITIEDENFKNIWIGPIKHNLIKPNKFMIRYTTNSNIGHIVNSNSADNSQIINVNKVEFDEDNNRLKLIIQSKLDVENISELYLYIDSQYSRYPFEFGTNAELEYDEIKI
jgi:hypothetical protein